MNGILRALFDDEYDITPKRDKKQRELDETLCAEWNKVRDALSVEFVDYLLTLEAERSDRQNFWYYQAGFRLGARLMLEALGD